MAYFLAIDAGGTKADYVLADETKELARVRSGTIKRIRTSAESAESSLIEALDKLTAQTGISLDQVTRTCVGTAGETIPLVTDWLRAQIGSRVSGELILRGDVEIALDAAFQGGEGVLVLAGTGSNVVGRLPNGRLTSAGGYGPALSDQGSGHNIGDRALHRLFLAHDEEIPTQLEQAVLDYWGLASLEEVVAYANTTPRPDVSRLTYPVFECAKAGDGIAHEVLAAEGEAIAYLAILVIRRLAKAAPGRLPALAFAGSVMEHIAPVREALMKTVHREFPSIRALDGVVDPVQGALWRARVGSQIAGIPAPTLAGAL